MSTTHVTPPIALHTVSATPNGPTAAPTNPPLPPHTLSNNSRTISQYIYHVASQTLGGLVWCGRRLLDIPRLLARSIWTVLKSFNKSTVILSIIIATVFGAVTWLALKIQAWTGRKDYLEYCRDNVSTLVGDALEDCQAAMKIGLPKPPLSNFKRTTTMISSMKWELRATTLLGRRQTLNPAELRGSMSTRDVPQDYTTAEVIESTFAIFTLCFILSMATITVGRIAWRKLDLDARAATSFSFMKRFCRSWQNAIMLVVSLTSILLTAAGTIVSVQSVRISQKSAELAFVQYCTTLKEDERTVECVDALASNHGSSRKDVASYAVDIFALISTILGLSSLAVAAFQMFRQRRIFGRYNKEQV